MVGLLGVGFVCGLDYWRFSGEARQGGDGGVVVGEGDDEGVGVVEAWMGSVVEGVGTERWGLGGGKVLGRWGLRLQGGEEGEQWISGGGFEMGFGRGRGVSGRDG